MLNVFLFVEFSLTIALFLVLGFISRIESHRGGVRVLDRVNSIGRVQTQSSRQNGAVNLNNISLVGDRANVNLLLTVDRKTHGSAYIVLPVAQLCVEV